MQPIPFSECTTEEQELIKKAAEAATHHYNTKGKRNFGAALQTESGKQYIGASIRRSASVGSTCSERMAIDRAVFAGEREIETIAVVGSNVDGDPSEIFTPCGACRQLMAETEGYSEEKKAINILCASKNLEWVLKTNSQELLPSGYIPYTESKDYAPKKSE